MRHISIISSSVREGRKSHNVSLYFHNYLIENMLATREILDLKAYNFAIFEGTLKTLIHPAENVLEFVDKIKSSANTSHRTPLIKSALSFFIVVTCLTFFQYTKL